MNWVKSIWKRLMPVGKSAYALGKRGYAAYNALPAEDKKRIRDGAKKLVKKAGKK